MSLPGEGLRARKKMAKRRVTIEIHNQYLNGQECGCWCVKFEGSENIWAGEFNDSFESATACAKNVVDKYDPPLPRAEMVTPSDCTCGGEE